MGPKCSVDDRDLLAIRQTPRTGDNGGGRGAVHQTVRSTREDGYGGGKRDGGKAYEETVGGMNIGGDMFGGGMGRVLERRYDSNMTNTTTHDQWAATPNRTLHDGGQCGCRGRWHDQVCLETAVPGEQWAFTSCLPRPHVFHHGCLQPLWDRARDERGIPCPMCRRNVEEFAKFTYEDPEEGVCHIMTAGARAGTIA